MIFVLLIDYQFFIYNKLKISYNENNLFGFSAVSCCCLSIL